MPTGNVPPRSIFLTNRARRVRLGAIAAVCAAFVLLMVSNAVKGPAPTAGAEVSASEAAAFGDGAMPTKGSVVVAPVSVAMDPPPGTNNSDNLAKIKPEDQEMFLAAAKKAAVGFATVDPAKMSFDQWVESLGPLSDEGKAAVTEFKDGWAKRPVTSGTLTSKEASMVYLRTQRAKAQVLVPMTLVQGGKSHDVSCLVTFSTKPHAAKATWEVASLALG